MGKDMVEAAKKAKCLEGFAREAMNEYADKNKLDAGDVLGLVIDTMKSHCQYNFFGCNDVEGYHVAYSLDDIAKAIGIDHNPTCEEVCEHGCCAYINRVLHGVGLKLYEDVQTDEK